MGSGERAERLNARGYVERLNVVPREAELRQIAFLQAVVSDVKAKSDAAPSIATCIVCRAHRSRRVASLAPASRRSTH